MSDKPKPAVTQPLKGSTRSRVVENIDMALRLLNDARSMTIPTPEMWVLEPEFKVLKSALGRLKDRVLAMQIEDNQRPLPIADDGDDLEGDD